MWHILGLETYPSPKPPVREIKVHLPKAHFHRSDNRTATETSKLEIYFQRPRELHALTITEMYEKWSVEYRQPKHSTRVSLHAVINGKVVYYLPRTRVVHARYAGGRHVMFVQSTSNWYSLCCAKMADWTSYCRMLVNCGTSVCYSTDTLRYRSKTQEQFMVPHIWHSKKPLELQVSWTSRMKQILLWKNRSTVLPQLNCELCSWY